MNQQGRLAATAHMTQGIHIRKSQPLGKPETS